MVLWLVGRKEYHTQSNEARTQRTRRPAACGRFRLRTWPLGYHSKETIAIQAVVIQAAGPSLSALPELHYESYLVRTRPPIEWTAMRRYWTCAPPQPLWDSGTATKQLTSIVLYGVSKQYHAARELCTSLRSSSGHPYQDDYLPRSSLVGLMPQSSLFPLHL